MIIGVGGSIAAGLAFSGQPWSHYELITWLVIIGFSFGMLTYIGIGSNEIKISVVLLLAKLRFRSFNSIDQIMIVHIMNCSHYELITIWINRIMNW